MKKIFLSLIVVLLMAGTSFAVHFQPPSQHPNALLTANATVDTASPVMANQTGGEDFTWNQGQVHYIGNASAKGNKSAEANVDGSGSTDFRSFSTQREIRGGELSVAFSKSNGSVNVYGSATGKDYGYFNGHDYAEVDLGVEGKLAQGNSVYSDDAGLSWAGTENTSSVNFSANENDRSFGMCSRTARAYEDLGASGTTFGGSAAWTKTTATKSVAKSVTFNTSNAHLDGVGGFYRTQFGFSQPDLSVSLTGNGSAGGMAQLRGMGTAYYHSSFEYTGGSNSYGMATGTATVQQTGDYSVQSSASASSQAGTFHIGNDR